MCKAAIGFLNSIKTVWQWVYLRRINRKRRVAGSAKLALSGCLITALFMQPVIAQTARTSDANTVKPEPRAYREDPDANPDNCKQLYNDDIWLRTQEALDLKQVSLDLKASSISFGTTADTISLTADIAKAITEATKGAGNASAAAGSALPAGDAPGHIAVSVAQFLNANASALKITAGGLKEVKNGLDVATNVNDRNIQRLNEEVQRLKGIQVFGGLPNCGTTFNGTIVSSVPAGQSGLTIKQGDLYVGGKATFDQDVEVRGTTTGNQFVSTQGIAAHNGQIILGNPDMQTYQQGITIGGGAFAGAGAGGETAFTGHFSAIAIGNGAEAWSEQSLAFGNGAVAEAAHTTAIGPGAYVALGAGAGSFAGGQSMVVSGIGAVSIGQRNQSIGDGAVSLGAYSYAVGRGSVALGDSNYSNGKAAISAGHGSVAVGTGTVAMGWGATATAASGVAVGTQAMATAENAVAHGSNSMALAESSTAIGAGSQVVATAYRSTAVGAGAVATLPQQMVLGTSETTYSAPGINSNLSRSRQSGPLGVVTSDANGNLASDDGALYREVATVKAAAAVAMAIKPPTLKNREKFGMQLSWGGYDGANAIGFSATGVLATGILTRSDRLSFSAAVGAGQADVNTYQENVVGGQAGIQWAW